MAWFSTLPVTNMTINDYLASTVVVKFNLIPIEEVVGSQIDKLQKAAEEKRMKEEVKATVEAVRQ